MVIDVILPCLDEEAALPWVLSRMPVGFRPLVADNGSTDRSRQVALDLGALVVVVPERGYGAACHAGLTAATSDVVVVMDCDASLDPADLVRLCAPVLDGSFDLVLGRRRPESWRAWPLPARLSNTALAWELRRRTGWPLHDLGPVRVARRRALLDLGLTDRRSGYPLETVLAASSAGWRLTELPVRYRQRIGRSKVTGSVGGYLRAAGDMRAVLAR